MRNKILNILSAAGTYVSGEEISRRLGISRAAVWKHIKKLKEDGYAISSVTNKGYMLTGAPQMLSAQAIEPMLTTRFAARNIKCMEETDSTNEEAKRCRTMPDGSLFIAEMQTAGKGRRGKGWEAPKGSGIYMSILLKPEISPESVSQLTLVAGMAVCRAIGGNAGIKWPNDIVIGSRKVCGILTEMSAEPECVNYVVCGIGINVNTPSFPEELSERATSLFLETGETHSRAELIAAVMNEFEPLYEGFLRGGFVGLREEYCRLCVNTGKVVQVICRGETTIGTAVDVDENGGLVVDTENGRISITSGEVSVRGIYGYV